MHAASVYVNIFVLIFKESIIIIRKKFLLTGKGYFMLLVGFHPSFPDNTVRLCYVIVCWGKISIEHRYHIRNFCSSYLKDSNFGATYVVECRQSSFISTT